VIVNVLQTTFALYQKLNVDINYGYLNECIIEFHRKSLDFFHIKKDNYVRRRKVLQKVSVV
jgi:hypothetical protein